MKKYVFNLMVISLLWIAPAMGGYLMVIAKEANESGPGDFVSELSSDGTSFAGEGFFVSNMAGDSLAISPEDGPLVAIAFNASDGGSFFSGLSAFSENLFEIAIYSGSSSFAVSGAPSFPVPAYGGHTFPDYPAFSFDYDNFRDGFLGGLGLSGNSSDPETIYRYGNNIIMSGVSGFLSGFSAAGGDPSPFIMAVWVLPDDDPAKPWSQLHPSMSFGECKHMKYMVVASDPNGVSDLSRIGIESLLPDGTVVHDISVSLSEGVCGSDGSFTEASDSGIVFLGETFSPEDISGALSSCDAMFYEIDADICCLPCAEFHWEYDGGWNLVCSGSGYGFRAEVSDASGLSGEMSGAFEYICSEGMELDFRKLDFGNVSMGEEKAVAGDGAFGSSLDVACASGSGCSPPTIRNTGNTPLNIGVIFDDMGFGEAAGWKAGIGGSLSALSESYENIYAGFLSLCGCEPISFSILVDGASERGEHSGFIQIAPEAAI